MQYIKQGYNECVLASMAMLAGVTLELANTVAKDVYNEMHPGLYYDTWDFAWSNLGNNDLRPYLQAITHKLGIRFKYSPTVRVLTEGRADLGTGKPDLRGRGQISVGRTSRSCGHSMVYENGLIYDPDKPLSEHGWTWDEFLKYEHINPEDTKDLVVRIVPVIQDTKKWK